MTSRHCPDSYTIRSLLKGELDSVTASNLWRHLAECDRCQTTFACTAGASEAAAEGTTRVAGSRVADGAVSFELDRALVEELPQVPGYEVVEQIGAGGMGVVYRAIDLRLDRPVAIKVVPPGHGPESPLCLRFLLEARLMARLEHPGIPPVHEIGRLPDGRPFLAMKLIHGRTLAQMLRERETPDADLHRFLDIFQGICETMAYAHEQGIVHRDLKPANVMVGAFGEVQVMDWGIARVVRTEHERPAVPPSFLQDGDKAEGPSETPRHEAFVTAAGSVIGTPMYAPPEQVRGELERIGPWSDVFSLGAILCTILTGAPPYRAAHQAEVLRLAEQAALDDAFRRLDQCEADPALVSLCKRCLAPDPANRPHSAREIVEELMAIRAATQQRLRQAELERAAAEARLAEQATRRRLWFSLAVVSLIGVVTSSSLAIWAVTARNHAIAAREAERRARENEVRLRRLAEQKEAEARRAAELARQAQKEAELRMTRLAATLDLLRTAFADLNISALRQENRPLEEVLGDRFRDLADRLMAEPVEDPLSHAAMLHQLGESLLSLGYYDDAVQLLERAASLRAEQLGPDAAETLRSRLVYAQALAGAGRYDEATGLLQEVHRRAARALGDGDPLTLKAAIELGYVYYLSGRGEDCIRLLEPIASNRVSSRDSVADELDIELMEVLGQGYAATGDFRRARELLRRVYEARTKLFGPAHSETLVALNNLAVVTFRSGDREAAVPLFEQAYRLASMQLGPDHPSVLTKLNNLGLVYRAVGDFEKAAEALSRCLRLTEQRLGPEHPHTAQSLNNLAVLYEAMGRFDEAEPLYRRALELRERLLGADHPNTINTRFSLGLIYLQLDRREEALRELDQTLQSLVRRRFSHDRAPMIVSRVTGALEERGLWTEAARWREAWLEARGGERSDDAGTKAVQCALLVRDYLEAGNTEDALKWAEKAEAVSTAIADSAWLHAFIDAVRTLASPDRQDREAAAALEGAYREVSAAATRIPPSERASLVSFLLARLVELAERMGDEAAVARWRLEQQRVAESLASGP